MCLDVQPIFTDERERATDQPLRADICPFIYNYRLLV